MYYLEKQNYICTFKEAPEIVLSGAAKMACPQA